MTTSASLRVQHFSDILCVWAYAAEIRMTELQTHFGSELQFDFHFFPVFGDVSSKLASQWSDRGGQAGYAAHVREVAARFDHIHLHADTWDVVAPVSSLPAHLLLCATRAIDRLNGTELATTLASNLRQAFFAEARDISRRDELFAIARQAEVPLDAINALYDSGQAYAELSADISLARDKSIAASPTLLFNEDRQRLTGNVGYQVIEANVRELLRNASDQQSWC